MVILQQDRAMPQGIELAGIGDRRLARRIAMRIVEFCRPADARAPLHYSVNLALPATSEISVDLILPGNDTARPESRIAGFLGCAGT